MGGSIAHFGWRGQKQFWKNWFVYFGKLVCRFLEIDLYILENWFVYFGKLVCIFWKIDLYIFLHRVELRMHRCWGPTGVVGMTNQCLWLLRQKLCGGHKSINVNVFVSYWNKKQMSWLGSWFTKWGVHDMKSEWNIIIIIIKMKNLHQDNRYNTVQWRQFFYVAESESHLSTWAQQLLHADWWDHNDDGDYDDDNDAIEGLGC